MLLEFHFLFISKSKKQYFVTPKMKFSFQWEHSRIAKFRCSICCKVRVIDFPISPETLYSLKFSNSNGLITQLTDRNGVHAAEREDELLWKIDSKIW